MTSAMRLSMFRKPYPMRTVSSILLLASTRALETPSSTDLTMAPLWRRAFFARWIGYTVLDDFMRGSSPSEEAVPPCPTRTAPDASATSSSARSSSRTTPASRHPGPCASTASGHRPSTTGSGSATSTARPAPPGRARRRRTACSSSSARTSGCARRWAA